MCLARGLFKKNSNILPYSLFLEAHHNAGLKQQMNLGAQIHLTFYYLKKKNSTHSNCLRTGLSYLSLRLSLTSYSRAKILDWQVIRKQKLFGRR